MDVNTTILDILDDRYDAVWDHNYSDDMNYILCNYVHQVETLKNEKRSSNDSRNRRRKKRNKLWFKSYNYDNLIVFVNDLRKKIDYMPLYDLVMNTTPTTYGAFVNELKNNNYTYCKKHNSGRYSRTHVIKSLDTGNDLIVKLTFTKNKKQLINSCKETMIQYYIYKLINLSPNIYFYYTYTFNNKLYTCIGMDKIRHVFYQLFDISKMYKCYKTQNTIVLNEFIKALYIYIGSLEKMLLNGVLHNDPHDGNFCFNENGSLYFIDFGKAKFIKKINNLIDNKTNTINRTLLETQDNYLYCSYLYDELTYFADMYYSYDDYSTSDKHKYNKFYMSMYSPIRSVRNSLKNNRYKFGYHLIHLTDNINIPLILDNINSKLLFID